MTEEFKRGWDACMKMVFDKMVVFKDNTKNMSVDEPKLWNEVKNVMIRDVRDKYKE